MLCYMYDFLSMPCNPREMGLSARMGWRVRGPVLLRHAACAPILAVGMMFSPIGNEFRKAGCSLLSRPSSRSLSCTYLKEPSESAWFRGRELSPVHPLLPRLSEPAGGNPLRPGAVLPLVLLDCWVFRTM